MPFEIGERVVHPHHGLGTIIGVTDRQFSEGGPRSYYEISIESGTMWVPVGEPGFGLRRLTDKSELDRCGRVLQGSPSKLDVDPRRLRSQLSDRLKEGTIIAHCEVVRDLNALGSRKPLYGPLAEFRRMALNVLCEEWATVAEISVEEAARKITGYLARGKRTDDS